MGPSDCRLLPKASGEIVKAHYAKTFAAAGTHGHCTSLHFLVANHDEVGDLLQAMFAYFIGNLLVTQIRLDPESGSPQLRLNLGAIRGLPLGDRQDDSLTGASQAGIAPA